MRGRMKRKNRRWNICIGVTYCTVTAKTFGGAVRKASRALGIQVFSDGHDGTFKDVFGSVVQ